MTGIPWPLHAFVSTLAHPAGCLKCGRKRDHSWHTNPNPESPSEEVPTDGR